MDSLAHECYKKNSMPLQFLMCSSLLSTKLRPVMKMFFLNSPLVFLNILGSKKWTFFGFVYNGPKVHGSKNHVYLNFQNTKFLSMEFVHDFNPFFNDGFAHATLLNHVLRTLNTPLMYS